MNRFILNETSYFGSGSRSVLAQEINQRGFQKVFLVSDNVLANCGVLEKVKKVLDDAKISYETFLDIKQNPTIKNCKDALAAFKKAKADCIVAVGGGSVMDTGKAVGIVMNNPEFADIKSLEGVAPTKNRCVPIIALPTTAGTAAEVTINYVITIEDEERKIVCVDPKDIPICAIIDAELMSSMPKGLIAATGMDALTHAIEGYITKGACEMSDMFSLKAIEMISRALRKASLEKDVKAIEDMATAQYIAGMSFSNVGLGIVHSMAHPLGSIFDIAHGVANALLLPVVMEFNKDSSIEKYKNIAVAMGGEIKGLNDLQAANLAIELVKKLSLDVGIPQKLSDIGIKEENISKLAAQAIKDVCTGGNPKDVDVNDIIKLYHIAL